MQIDLVYILAGAGLLLIVWWAFFRSPSYPSSSGAVLAAAAPVVSHSVDDRRKGEAYVIRQGLDGPERVKAKRNPDDGGYAVGSEFYPDELLKDLGGGNLLLASHCELPASGRFADGDVDQSELVVQSQLYYMAHFRNYYAAVRRIQFRYLFHRGGGTPLALKNVIQALVLIVALSIWWSTSGLRDTVKALEANTMVLSGQMARLSGESVLPVPGAQQDGSLVPPVKAGE